MDSTTVNLFQVIEFKLRKIPISFYLVGHITHKKSLTF